jgi:gliding motility-associated-like protein
MNASIGTPEPGVTYSWTPADNVTSSNTAQTVSSVSLTEGSYVFIINANNGICQNSDTVSLVIEPIQFKGFPTAFSPNGDGVNDIFRPTPYPTDGIEILEFEVFNRWGQKVFSTTDQREGEEGWDGKFNGTLQPRDYYIYTFTYRFPGEITPKQLRGQVTLLR